MASVFSTFTRGMVGVVAAVLIVAVTWTIYIKRDTVIGASEPVMRMFSSPDTAHTADASTPPVVETPGPGPTDAQVADGKAASDSAPTQAGGPALAPAGHDAATTGEKTQ